jgi:hypothetical protein
MDLVTTQSGTTVQLFAGDFPRVLKPATVVSGAGVLAKGTVLGIITATGAFNAYADAGLGGLDVAKAILSEDVDATAAAVNCSVYFAGDFNEAALTGLTAAAKVDFIGTPIFIGKVV